MIISSNVHDYEVNFSNFKSNILNHLNPIYMIDDALISLYDLSKFKNKLVICPSENAKTLENINDIIKILIEDYHVKRNTTLVAVGGGIIQDITSFISSILFRGMDWVFYPTTLLAQADSCIGSKTSINIGNYKNQVGTFYPPRIVNIDVNFLKTLPEREINSGRGEIIKIHLLADKNIPQDLNKQIKSSLNLKLEYITKDEYDKGIRNLLNYGHSFGHAIESATNFRISHGEAVIIGMDIANFISYNEDYLTVKKYNNLADTIYQYMPFNYFPFTGEEIENITESIKKDKKNISSNDLSLILTKGSGNMFKAQLPNDIVKSYIKKYFKEKNVF